MRHVLPVAIMLMAAAVAPAAEPQPPNLGDIQLADLQGQVFKIRDFLGTVTVLNFWASWCGPCRQELPELQKLSNDLGGRGLVVLAVAVDTPKAAVKPFMERMGLTLPVYLMDAQTQAALGISQIPLSVLLDREGVVVKVYPGYAPVFMEDIRERAVKALGEKPAPAKKLKGGT